MHDEKQLHAAVMSLSRWWGAQIRYSRVQN
jgi:hypothetical protein